MAKPTYIPLPIVNKFGENAVGSNGKDEVIYLCPYCSSVKGSPDTKGHLYVNTKKLVYFCVRCGTNGSISSQVPKSKSYKSTKCIEYDEHLSDELSGLVGSESQSEYLRYPYKIPMKKITDSPAALDYMISRGFTIDQLKFYELRVGTLNDRNFGRVVIPNQVHDHVYTDMYCSRSYIGHKNKYLNPVGENKSKVVFNLHRINPYTDIHICEGALSSMAAGYNAVALYGKFISNTQLSLILNNHPTRIYVSLDPDARKESNDLCNKLRDLTDVDIIQVIMPEGQDPASLGHEHYMDIALSSKPYSNLELELLSVLTQQS